MNVTLKDVPPDLHQRLQVAARESGRSLNKLILHALRRQFCPRKASKTELFERIRRRRSSMEIWIDDESLSDAIEGDRE